MTKNDFPFDAIVWVSAKEEKLTVIGIEPIDVKLRNYESVIDSILETFGWLEDLNKALTDKEESVDIILGAGDKGILLVIDNLETINDDRVHEFIKDFPPPNKVLITSRLGLGEVERRYPLKELNPNDAISLLRTIAREKGALELSKLPDDILSKYVDKMSRYPLAIKWVVGQVAIGKDINIAIGDLTSSSGDVAKFCFEHIFDKLLNSEDRMVMYALASNERPLVRGVLSHITNLNPEQLDAAIRNLSLASLVIPIQIKTSDSTIETKYELLPLTKNYIQSKLKAHPEIHKDIIGRTEAVQNLIEEADRAGKQYRYSLSDMGAESEEEKIAATWAITAYQKFQADDYDGSVKAFERAAQIAPSFPAVYRNWATMECEAGFYGKADVLMQKATNLNKEDSGLWFVWGNIAKRKQDFDKAYEYLSKAKKLEPDDAPILGSLGEIQKRRGYYEEAEKFLLKALEGTYKTSHRKHEIICYTALADNLRRWSKVLALDKQIEKSTEKLFKAYETITKALDLNKDDNRTRNTFLEIVKDLAFNVLRYQTFEKAEPFFIEAITDNPKTGTEKRINSIACLKYAEELVHNNRIEDAKKFYLLGKNTVLPDSSYVEKYNNLEIEFFGSRSEGRLVRVKEAGGYGFIESDSGQVFVHISNMIQKISNTDFKNLEGSKVDFIEIQSEKGIEAKRVRIL